MATAAQLSVGDGNGKFIVEEELEVFPCGLSVWLEDLVAVRLLIPLPGDD
jgi:hypothetical protein